MRILHIYFYTFTLYTIQSSIHLFIHPFFLFFHFFALHPVTARSDEYTASPLHLAHRFDALEVNMLEGGLYEDLQFDESEQGQITNLDNIFIFLNLFSPRNVEGDIICVMYAESLKSIIFYSLLLMP